MLTLAADSRKTPRRLLATIAIMVSLTVCIAAAPLATTGAPTLRCRSDVAFGVSMNSGSSRTDNRVDRIIQKSFSDVRVCVLGEDLDGREARPSDWLAHGNHVLLESEERGGDLRRLEMTRGVTTYSVNGRPQSVDGNVQEWRNALLGLADAMWEASELRGQVSSLRGEISSIRGERSSLEGEISSLRGEVSSMQGQISSYRGEESSLRGEISSIRGHLSSLQGAISSEQGAISSLQASRNDRYAERGSIDAAIRRHEDEIGRLRAEIDRYDADGKVRDVERRIASFDADAKVRDMERRIRDFDLDGRIADVRRRIARLDVDGQVRSIEERISALDADRRVAALEVKQDAALQTLRAQLRR